MPTTSDTLMEPRDVKAILESMDRAKSALNFEHNLGTMLAHHFDPAAIQLVKANLEGALAHVTTILNRETGIPNH